MVCRHFAGCRWALTNEYPRCTGHQGSNAQIDRLGSIRTGCCSSTNGCSRRTRDSGCRDRRWSALYPEAGCISDVVGDDASGQVDLAALERTIGPRTKLIAITQVPTQGGLVQSGGRNRPHSRAPPHPLSAHACQSVGRLAVEVPQIGCHMPSAPGRKYLRGRRGTGFSVRAARHDRNARAAFHRSRGPPHGSTPTPTSPATMRAGSKTGSGSSPARSASASPPVMHSG